MQHGRVKKVDKSKHRTSDGKMVYKRKVDVEGEGTCDVTVTVKTEMVNDHSLCFGMCCLGRVAVRREFY